MDNVNNKIDNSVSWNFNDVLAEVARQKFVIIALLAVSVLVSVLYTKLFTKPSYTTCAKIYVLNSSSDSGKISSSDLTIASYLTRDYSELIVDRTVLDEVNKELDLGYSYSKIKNMVTVNNPTNTRILEISVQSDEPKSAQKIANKICEVAQQKIVDLMAVDTVNIISDAYLPTASNSSGLQQNISFGVLIGVVASCVYIFFCYYRNDKIRGSEEVQKYLGLCTLGTIPYNQTKARRTARQKAVGAKNGR